MNYKIITDEDAVKRFINWLPDLEVNEKFYWCLFARKKYSPNLVKSNDRTQLKRGLATKENLLNKLYQLELPLDRWVLKDVPAPQEALVVYINPNPRNIVQGTWLTVQKLLEILKNHSNGHNPIAETLSAMQQSKSYNFVVDFDIDVVTENGWTKEGYKDIIKDRMRGILPLEFYRILETRGGYHILVCPPGKKDHLDLKLPKGQIAYMQESGKIFPVNWYVAIQNAFGENLDQAGDQLIPIPGCIQGGFTPKFI